MFCPHRMKHIIITPYYVWRHFSGQAEPKLAGPTWLAHRLQLFEKYCLPSVTSQSDQNFEWFIYFDVSTAADYLGRIRALTSKYENISIKLCSHFDPAKDVLATLTDSMNWVITTRLDNDDGLRRDFVSTLHAAVQEREEFLNFPRGIILYSGKCFIYKHYSNAFISFVEPAERPRTVWSVAHTEAAKVAPVRQLPESPAFLQVVHDKNISNKPRGTRIHSRQALIGFETITALQGQESGETAQGVLLENLTTVIIWKLRDFLISLARVVRR